MLHWECDQWREAIPASAQVRAHLEHFVQFCAPSTREVWSNQGVQRRSTQMTKGNFILVRPPRVKNKNSIIFSRLCMRMDLSADLFSHHGAEIELRGCGRVQVKVIHCCNLKGKMTSD